MEEHLRDTVMVCHGRAHALNCAHAVGLVTGQQFRSLRGQLVNDADSVAVFLRRFFRVTEYCPSNYWDGTLELFHYEQYQER